MEAAWGADDNFMTFVSFVYVEKTACVKLTKMSIEMCFPRGELMSNGVGFRHLFISDKNLREFEIDLDIA